MRSLKFLVPAVVLGTTLGLYSCSESEDWSEDVEQEQVMKTCSLTLNLDLDRFGSRGSRAAADSASVWKHGDKIYVYFEGNSYGVAEFSGSSKLWTISYYGSLKYNQATACQLQYFENPEYENAAIVKPTPSTAIYEDLDASYMFDGKKLTITGTVSPKTGRIRFQGDAGTKLLVEGISTYDAYEVSAGEFSMNRYPVSLEVDSITGYTPYIYGEFTDTVQPKINVITEENGFTRNFSKDVLSKSASGWLTVPTDSAHANWFNKLVFDVDTVSFTMLPVVKVQGSTKKLYFLGQTEVTQELFYTAGKMIKPETGFSARCPIYSANANSTDFKNMISKLKVFTGMDFKLPSREEWLFAAKGGMKSVGYIYCGSDDVNKVAWYSGNSGDVVHEVGCLAPNELGFYDMSGNVSEYDVSSNLCGGDYGDSYSYVKYDSYNTSSYSSSDHYGFRLALSVNFE